MEPTIHDAVLIEETMQFLNVQPGGLYIDGTLGGGTHSEQILKESAPDGRVLSIDVDLKALERAKTRFAPYGDRWLCRETNFRFMADVAREADFMPVDGVLLDLGLSSDELADRSKGFSFMQDGPLDMRLGPKANEDGLTAADIVNTWSVEDIETAIRNFGEERFAGRIAHAILKARHASRIIGTLDLVTVIKQATPNNYEQGRIHPATRTFQALRIAVNDELESLKQALEGAIEVLKPGGRLAVISFHSMEDRIVKQRFLQEDVEPLTKRPVTASDEEVARNPRSRSAKLRVATKK